MSEDKTTVSWEAVPGSSITYIVEISTSVAELAKRAKEAQVKARDGDKERSTGADE